MIVQKVGRVIV
jgi:hypothetical protein